MAQPTSLKIFPKDFPNRTTFVSVIVSQMTKSDEVIRITLERLQIFEDQSNYQLCLGAEGNDDLNPLNPDDCPFLVFEDEKRSIKKTMGVVSDLRFYIRKQSTPTSLLTSLVGAVSVSMETSLNVDDLCKLDDLTEKTMLSILRNRFDKSTIYTYVGSILIAINPYYFYSIYNPKYSTLYQGHHMGELPPHIFAIADDAYNSMLNDKSNQAVIISGESGAGKTESTKFLLHQLMQLSAKFEETSSLDLITLGTGPVLEAFGNAKTVANNNSSRFGKFILVKFKENGAYFGASIEKYLLEKSRIISQAPGERNYHVFYYLLSGASPALKEKLHLLSLGQYRYLSQQKAVSLEGVEEPAEFERLCQSLAMLKFTPEIQNRMFTVLSAILHTGNIDFNKNDPEEGVHITNMSTVHIVSQLLQVDEEILSTALVTRKSKAGGMDSFVTHYRLDEAIATRDAMAKALYGALFDWIVDKVNEALVAQYAKGSHKGHTIGVLDIFGFEVFQKNSFEQFCINFANEQLQQYFNKHIFKLEQMEYQSEGIEWTSVEFVDNNECLDLIAKKPTGLLPLLDEECSFPGADDISLFEKFERQHKSNRYYSSPQMKQREPYFTISHYASPVTYSIQGFREKNRDLMRQDVVDVLKTSRMDLVRSLIGLLPYAVHRWHIAIQQILAIIAFKDAGKKRKERREENWTASAPVILYKNPPSSSPEQCDSDSDVSRSSTPELILNNGESHDAFPLVLGGPVKTKFGFKLSKVYEVSGARDYPDGAPVYPPPATSTERHPSIAHILKKKWHRTVRARVEEEKEREEDAWRDTGRRGSKDRLWQSAPRVKPDAYRPSLPGGKLQQLAVSPSTSRRGQTKTVSAEFHSSLISLMEQLEKTHPYFVRCIKSNGKKASCEFDAELVTRQLRYTGMMETIRIRKAGYSVRIPFEDFYEKYQFLIGRREKNLPDQIRKFLEDLGFSSSDIQIGRTKVFMRDKQKRVLQDVLQEKVLAKIVLIQQWIRAKLYRCQFLHIRRSALMIQTIARGWLVRRHFNNLRKKICSAVIIQTAWRGVVCRRNFLECREAAIVFQSHWRGLVARRRYLQLLENERQLEEERKRKEREKQIELEEKKKRTDKNVVIGSNEATVLEPAKNQKGMNTLLDDINSTLQEFDQIFEDISSGSSTSLVEATPTENLSSLYETSKEENNCNSVAKQPLCIQATQNVKKIREGFVSPEQSSPTLKSPPTNPVPHNTVKDIIRQLSPSPSPPPSPKLNSPKSAASSNRISKFSAYFQGKHDREPLQAKKSTGHAPIGRVKSPFFTSEAVTTDLLTDHRSPDVLSVGSTSSLDYQMTTCSTEQNSSGTSQKSCDDHVSILDNSVIESGKKSPDSHVTKQHGSLVELNFGTSVKRPSLTMDSEDSLATPTETKIGPNVHKKPMRKTPLHRVATGPKIDLESHTLSKPVATPTLHLPLKENLQSDTLLLDSLSDEELEIPSQDNVTVTTSDKVYRSNSALCSRNIINNEDKIHNNQKRRHGVRSVGDANEIVGLEDSESLGVPLESSNKTRSLERSSELTTGISPENIYQLNFQTRHSFNDTLENGGRSSDETSPGEKERFVVKKRWGRKSPKSSNRVLIKDSATHPLLSKIQRISSPMSSGGESGSSTPTPGSSPKKIPKQISKSDLIPFQHTFKTSSMNKSQLCKVCSKAFSGFLKQGSKCVCCGILVHKHCQDRAPICRDLSKPGQQVTMGTEVVVRQPEELDELAQFLVEKHHMHFQQMSQLHRQDRIEPIDRVFQMALSEFHSNLISKYSLSFQDTSESSLSTSESSVTSSTKNSEYTFEQLVNKFASIYRNMARREDLLVDSSDVAISINQIRTFLDEFVKTRQQRQRPRTFSNDSKVIQKIIKRKHDKEKDLHIKTHKGHKFALTQFHVITVCDQCSKLILVLEKGEKCQECNYACHENCMKKASKCEGKRRSRAGMDKYKIEALSPSLSKHSQFGVPLESLVPVGVVRVPIILEKCFNCIENHGLYTQGIYRRSAGGTSKRAVREALDSDPEQADLENFSLYAVAATVTSFFRELPEPLLTHQYYNDFIRATDLSDSTDMMETFHKIIDQLPDLNHCVFERLMFHLARVAQQESVNKMDPHNLAIIFSPTLLQGPNSHNPDQLLKMMPKQTMVIELIIKEQLMKLTATLRGIHNLTSVARNTAYRISFLTAGENKIDNQVKVEVPTKRGQNMEEQKMTEVNDNTKEELSQEKREEEKKKLKSELRLIEKERAVLTASLPKLEPFSPIDTKDFHFSHPTSLQQNHTSSSASNTSGRDITGTGREEFLKRQSMFTGGTPKEVESSSGLKRHSLDPSQATNTKEDMSKVTVVVIDEENGEEDIVENVSDDHELPELPPVEVLRPLTKNRVSQPALVKRRGPTHNYRNIIIQSDSLNS